MYKKHLSFLPIHIIVTLFLLFFSYMGSGAPTASEPFEMWLFLTVIFFPISSVGNIHLLYTKRKESNSIKAFMISLPILFIPYLLLLFLMLNF